MKYIVLTDKLMKDFKDKDVCFGKDYVEGDEDCSSCEDRVTCLKLMSKDSKAILQKDATVEEVFCDEKPGNFYNIMAFKANNVEYVEKYNLQVEELGEKTKVRDKDGTVLLSYTPIGVSFKMISSLDTLVRYFDGDILEFSDSVEELNGCLHVTYESAEATLPWGKFLESYYFLCEVSNIYSKELSTPPPALVTTVVSHNSIVNQVFTKEFLEEFVNYIALELGIERTK